LYAPSSVGTFGYESTQPDLSGGTSFSAPLVAGTAGLLLAFDSRLVGGTLAATSEIKRLLLDGARRSVVGTDTIRVLDAYGALKAAAQRPGAPLCGNRVWADGAVVKTQRGPSDESLFTAPGRVVRLFTLHGGKRLDVQYLVNEDVEPFFERATYRWTNASWTRDANGPADPFGPFTPGPDPTGASRSPWGISHDFSELVAVGAIPATDGTRLTAYRSAVDGSRFGSLGSTALSVAARSDSVCRLTFDDGRERRCGAWVYGGQFVGVYGSAVSPMETETFAVVGATDTRVTQGSVIEPCSSRLANPICFATSSVTLERGWLVRFTVGGTTELIDTLSNEIPVFVTVSEDGEELAVGIRKTVTSGTECRIEWRDSRTKAVRHTVKLAVGASCRDRFEPFTHAAMRSVAAKP
jgi:hypothetical protein